MESILNEQFILEMFQGEYGKEQVCVEKFEIKNNILERGNNFKCDAFRVEAHVKIGSNTIVKSLFIKIPFNSPLYDIVKRYNYFTNETYMYEEILPLMEKLLPTKEGSLAPRGYRSKISEVVVMEDLQTEGYVVLDRTAQLDFRHAAAAIDKLAIFHALSVSLNRDQPRKLDPIRRDLLYNPESSDFVPEGSRKFFEAGITKMRDIIEDLPGADKFQEKLRTFDLWKVTRKHLSSSGKFDVLCHGDFWINNFMFKYDEAGALTDTKIIDFQTIKYCSPASDIIYFVITSVRFPVFQRYLDLLLELYHETLTKTLAFLKCPLSYTLQDLKAEVKEGFEYGIFVIASLLPIILNNPKDPMDMKKVTNDIRKGTEKFEECNKSYGSIAYTQAVEKWIKYYTDNDLL